MKPTILIIALVFSFSLSFSQRGKLQRRGSVTSTSSNKTKKDEKKSDTAIKERACNCDTDLFYDEAKDITYIKTEANQPAFTGTCVSWYRESKTLKFKSSFVKGKEHGKTYKFHENGIPNALLSHNMGVPDGEWKFWTEDSVLRWSKNYSMGKLDGDQKWFYPSGNLRKSEAYANGIREGKTVEYYKDSTLKKEIHYKNNQFHGSYKKYAKDSTLIIEKNFHNGQLDGENNFYYNSGAIGYKKFYKKGKKDGTWTYYYENGNEKATEFYKNGKKDGTWKSYHDNLKLHTEIIYKKDKEISKREYDRYGREQ